MTKKQLWSLARLLLPGVGMVLTCLGAYLLALQTENWILWRIILTYILMGLGCLCVLVGFFWTICHSMKSKIYRRRERHIQVYTVERPTFYLPSYEESQRSHVETSPPDVVFGVNELILTPPPYSADGSEDPDWDRPPRYSLVEHIQHGEE